MGGQKSVRFTITIKKFDRRKVVGDFDEITYGAKLDNCGTDGCRESFDYGGISDKNKLKDLIMWDFKRHFRQKHPNHKYSVSFRDG